MGTTVPPGTERLSFVYKGVKVLVTSETHLPFYLVDSKRRYVGEGVYDYQTRSSDLIYDLHSIPIISLVT